MKRNKIVLHGSYFGDNFGDRLFIEMFVEWLSNIEGLETENIVLPFANNRIRNSLPVSKSKGVFSLRGAKCVIYTGGGYFGEFKKSIVWSARLVIRHLLLAIWMILFRKPIIIVGVGAGPLSNFFTRKLVTFVCNRSYKTIVRDKESYDFLRSYGVKADKLFESVDSVLILDNFNDEKSDETDSVKIGVHLAYPFENSTIKQIITDIKKYTDSLDDYEIRYFKDFYKEGFYDYAEEVIKETFPKNKIAKLEYLNPKQLIKEIGKFDILFTVKLHVGIVAFTQGVRTFSIGIHQKTQRLYNQLNFPMFTKSLGDYRQGDINDMLTKTEGIEQKVDCEIVKKAVFNKNEVIDFIHEFYLSE